MGLLKYLFEIKSNENAARTVLEHASSSTDTSPTTSNYTETTNKSTNNNNTATTHNNKEEKLRDVVIVFGDWRLGDSVKKNGVYNEEDFQTVKNLKLALFELNSKTLKYKYTFLDNHKSLFTDLRSLSRNTSLVVLNLCDEGYNNDALLEAHVPSFMDTLNLTYSGAGPTCLGLCYDKAIVRAIAVSIGVPVPEEVLVDPLFGNNNLSEQSFRFPRFLKPALGDNSIGITPGSVVHDQQQLENYVKELNTLFPDRPVLIQEYLTGAEYSVGIIGNTKTGFFHLPILEVDYSDLDSDLPPILGYESKFIPESPYWTQIKYKKADSLSEETQQKMYRHAELLFERCKCRDYARFDFRADHQGIVKLLEVNPNPGWCWDGKLNKMAAMCGLSYSELIGKILCEVEKRK